MFVRTKKVKEYFYAYLVKNKWTKKGPRQKTCKYLGRVTALKPFSDIEFEDFCSSLEDLSSGAIVRTAVAFELYKHGFQEHKKNVWKLNDFYVDLEKAKVRVGKKPVVLSLNNDFLCDFTLKNLVKFKSNKDENGVAMDLAKAFVQAGIPVREDIFIRLFQLIFNPGQSFIADSKKKYVIIVTGTPGTGKTTLSKKLAKNLRAEYIDVNKVIENNYLINYFDNERQCNVVDEEKLAFALKDIIKKSSNPLVIDSHMSHVLPKNYVTCCIVTRCELPNLRKRLEEREYSQEKIKENLESEIFEICLQEALESHHKIIEVQTDTKVDFAGLKKEIMDKVINS